jgi:hypothetical protein
MRALRLRRRMAPLLTIAVFGLLWGCAAVLGIADEVNRGDEGGAAGTEGGGSDDGTMTTVDGAPMPGDGGNTNDGAMLGDAKTDATIPAACTVTKDFSAPQPLTSINTPEQEGSAHFTEDELTIFFDAQRGGAKFDLYTATRASLGAPFGASTPIPGAVNTALDEFSPNVTTDGLTIFFERQDATGVSRLMVSTRVVGGMFGAGVAMGNLDSNSYTANPFVRGAGAEIYYVSDTGTLTPINIYRGKRQPDGTYAGTVLANVNANVLEIEPFAPVVSKDGLTLYFASDQTVAGFMGHNIYVAKRATTALDFGVPALVPNVNGDADEQPSWISGDGCRLYIVSNRTAANNQDIFVATRPK